jgi:dTDP-4-dehydrorhamnose 3,5-epimerase
MNVTTTKLPGVVIIEPKLHGDSRGYFLETFQVDRYKDLAGIDLPFVQDNQSRSAKGVLRGLHYQIKKPQGKLVRVTRGEVFDVAVDINSESKTYGQWEGVHLSEENHLQFYVPPGYAHGFVVLSEIADFSYKCTDYYDPADEGGVHWQDSKIGIDWPISAPLVSAKDSSLPFIQ